MNKKNVSSNEGLMLDIQRFSVHDGPGIRTSVFLKGCPLSCMWCHNPESINPKHELYYNSHQCVACGRCVDACANQCHKIIDGKHFFDRTSCKDCFACVDTCYFEALKIKGVHMSVESIIEIVMRDDAYYKNSGGGVTISGGEPTYQPEFLESLLQGLKQYGVHVCLDTCGYCDSGYLDKISEYVDIFLYDFKLYDSAKHIAYTGVGNADIIKNLELLDKKNSSIILRCPIIPGINDSNDHLERIAQVCEKFKSICEVHIMPYHSTAGSKWILYDMDYKLKDVIEPSSSFIEEWINKLNEKVNIPVCRG